MKTINRPSGLRGFFIMKKYVIEICKIVLVSFFFSIHILGLSLLYGSENQNKTQTSVTTTMMEDDVIDLSSDEEQKNTVNTVNKFEDDFKEIENAINNYEYNVATKLCESILRKDPGNSTAQQYLEKAKNEQTKAATVSLDQDKKSYGNGSNTSLSKADQLSHIEGRLSNVEVKKVLTNCQSSVEILNNSFRLGSGWCFYKIDFPVQSNDYTFEFDAKLESESGYGIWFRGAYSDRVNSFGVQFDPGAGGIKFLKYPETESAFYSLRYNCDNSWHHWKLYGKGSTVKVFLDGNLILDRKDILNSGSDFGFRTWRGKVLIKNITINTND
jgi:hypothetical protein